MQYAVGEQVEAEKMPFVWNRGTVEVARGDSYEIRFDPQARGGRSDSDLREIDAGRVRTAGGTQLLTALSSGSPPRLRSPSPSPRLELSPPHLNVQYAGLSEQVIRDRSECRKLEERLLACEHMLSEVGPQAQMRRDDTVARLEQRLDELERATRREVMVTQRRASDALAKVQRVSVAPAAQPTASAAQAARQLERRVSALETSPVPDVCREIERKLAALATRVEAQSLSASLSASPAVSRNSVNAKAVEALEGRVEDRLQDAVREFRRVSLGEVAAVEQRMLSTLEPRIAEAARQSVRCVSFFPCYRVAIICVASPIPRYIQTYCVCRQRGWYRWRLSSPRLVLRTLMPCTPRSRRPLSSCSAGTVISSLSCTTP
jgi:hypothetical protein